MITYVTDHKWKPFTYRADLPKAVQEEFPLSYGDHFFQYRGAWFSLGEFSRTVSTDLFDENCPITPHGVTGGSAFHSVLIELSEDGESYRICLAKSS